jgi:methylthioribose-1-phosphate isomerase
MIYNGKQYRSIWLSEDEKSVEIIDQRFIPFKFVVEKIETVDQMAAAIKDMHLRGAPLIGAAAAWGMYIAALEAKSVKDFNLHLKISSEILEKTRPTAINLKWALDKVNNEISKVSALEEIIEITKKTAEQIADDDAESCRKIGVNGLKLIEDIARRKNGKTVEILTHCNAGALACVDWGTATSPMYHAQQKGIKIHVWVDETRPRNQGKLTSWELEENGVDNTIICDNTGGYLMSKGMVDIVIVGTDRTTANGDAANKIGTYLKALAAKDNNIPFYVALPLSSIDFNMISGNDIPIEERDQEEVLSVEGIVKNNVETVRLFSHRAKAANYGFDVTPARLITGFITEKGIFEPEEIIKLKK